MAVKKVICPITRKQFHENKKAIEVIINGQKMMAEPREFSTGSLGWYLNGKPTIEVGGTPVIVQIGLNMTIAGSKELPADPSAAPAAPAAPTEPTEPAENA